MAARLTAYVVVAIVSATLIAGLMVGAQRDDDGPVDLIVHNARIYTADEDRSMAEAVAIRGNQILKVGSNREINRLRRPQTIVIDAQGAAVVPGFNDSHVHFVDGGLALDAIDLQGVATAEAIQERLKAWAAAKPTEPWILANGWDERGLDVVPTRQLLDAAVADRPVRIVSQDGKTSWLNSKALTAAAIDRRTPHPSGGLIVKDRRGEPTGLLKDGATQIVERLLPQPTPEKRALALRAAIDAANRQGITSVQTAGDSLDDLALYDAARRAGDLTVRVYGSLALSAARLADSELDRLAAVATKYPDDPLFKTGAVTLKVDDDVESHGAVTFEPYADKATPAEPLVDPDTLNRTVRILDAYGWQVRTEASGDRAVNMALNAYAHAVRSNRTPKRERRHRIEHVEGVSEEDLPRFASLGVIAAMQPEDTPVDIWTKYLGEERAKRLWPYRSIAAAGARLAFGSDWPEQSLDPIEGLKASVDPSIPPARTTSTTSSTERIALKAAIDAYTSGAAYASFDEQRKGSISPGMLADLVVLTDDIFDSDTVLAKTKVAVTIFDGKIVYRRGQRTTN